MNAAYLENYREHRYDQTCKTRATMHHHGVFLKRHIAGANHAGRRDLQFTISRELRRNREPDRAYLAGKEQKRYESTSDHLIALVSRAIQHTFIRSTHTSGGNFLLLFNERMVTIVTHGFDPLEDKRTP